MDAASGRKLTPAIQYNRVRPNFSPLLRTAILGMRALFIPETEKAIQTANLNGSVSQGHPCFYFVPAG